MTIATYQRQVRRHALMQRHKGRCVYCDRLVRVYRRRKDPPPPDTATEDHVIPKSRGGTDRLSNLVLACWGCNNERGDMPAEIFLERKAARRGREGVE